MKKLSDYKPGDAVEVYWEPVDDTLSIFRRPAGVWFKAKVTKVTKNAVNCTLKYSAFLPGNIRPVTESSL